MCKVDFKLLKGSFKIKETIKVLYLERTQATFVDRKLDYMLILSWFHLFTFNLIKKMTCEVNDRLKFYFTRIK